MKVESAIRLRNELAEGGSEASSEVSESKDHPIAVFRKPVHARAAELGRNERNKGDEKGQHAFRFAWRGGGSFLAIVFAKIV